MISYEILILLGVSRPPLLHKTVKSTALLLIKYKYNFSAF
nr:MAG TPA: hypothetical protein [Bacteriophage sp.]